MWITLLLLLIFVGCIAALYTDGMWSNAIGLINVVTAALLATNFWEPAADWLERLAELGVATILTTLPVIEDGERFNEGVVWSREDRVVEPVHRKRYLPEEEGFWEASWYSRGEGDFRAVALPGARAGFMICSEQWFTQHARDYGRQGVQLIASPRATYSATPLRVSSTLSWTKTPPYPSK